MGSVADCGTDFVMGSVAGASGIGCSSNSAFYFKDSKAPVRVSRYEPMASFVG